MVMQFAQFLINPAIAGAMGKLIRIGDQRALQTNEGSINMVVANKFLVTVEGSADIDAKLAYAQRDRHRQIVEDVIRAKAAATSSAPGRSRWRS